MNAERLLASYDRIAEAPDAIARLRRLILDLAVRGKLVPQDPNDEPAQELRVRIAREKANLGQTDLPRGWVQLPLGGLVVFRYGKGLKKSERADEGPIPVFGSNGIVGFTDRPLTEQPSIIVGRKGSAGALNLCDGPSWTTDVAYYVESPPFIDIRLLLLALRAMDLDQLARGVKPGLSRSAAYLKLIRVPPLPEQHRIVAKVDEMMALCDRLESASKKRERARDLFGEASLARLNEPDPSSFREDARFAIDYVGALTVHSNQIRTLRQTILNLAVRGRLVPQEPNDESAADLLARIAAAKAERKRRTGDHRIKSEPSPKRDELPIPLPSGWAVQSFANLFLFIDYRGKTPPKTDAGIPLITAKNIRMGHLNREPREYISAKTFETWMTRGLPQMGDLFFTTEAPLANVCLNDIDEPFALAQRTICLQPYATIDTKFFMFALISEPMQALIGAQATGLTAKGIKAAKLKPLPIPVPPLAEQHRIVAKVEELMALTDRLERRLAEQAALRSRLFGALLNEATVAA